jgi:hypothetical protein
MIFIYDVYVCMYVCMYVCIYIYIYIYVPERTYVSVLNGTHTHTGRQAGMVDFVSLKSKSVPSQIALRTHIHRLQQNKHTHTYIHTYMHTPGGALQF